MNAQRQRAVVPIEGHRLKHVVVADELEHLIRSGDLAPGVRLSGEHELAREFAVSRGTIRRALGELSERSLIDTRVGAGSFVTFDGREIDSPDGWTSALSAAGIALDTEVLRCEIVAEPELAIQFGTATNRFLAIDRVRRLPGGAAVSIERAMVPAVGRIADVPERGLVDDSLTKTLRSAELIEARGEQWVQVVPLSAQDAALLGRVQGESFMHTVKVTQDAQGGLVEKVTSVLDPDHFRVHMSFGGQP